MTIKNDDARRAYNIHGVKPTTSEKVLNAQQNKIIDADEQQAANLIPQIRDRLAAARHLSPIIEAKEVKA